MFRTASSAFSFLSKVKVISCLSFMMSEVILETLQVPVRRGLLMPTEVQPPFLELKKLDFALRKQESS